MAPGLEDCPDEIVEEILFLLELEDICSLRQSCRALAAKCTHNHFKSFFRSKRVELTETALQELTELIQPGRLGCLVQELTLIGLLPHGSTAKEFGNHRESRDKEIKLLSQAFSSLICNSETGKLLSLSLKVLITSDSGQKLSPTNGGRTYAELDKKVLWQCAADTFHVTWVSLATSGILIDRLEIFNNQQMKRCSLASNCLSEMQLQNSGLVKTFASLQSISMSLSSRFIDRFEMNKNMKTQSDKNNQPNHGIRHDDGDDLVPQRRGLDDLRTDADDDRNFSGLGEFLKACSSLQSFELHYFFIRNAPVPIEDLHFERLLQRVIQVDQLPQLSQCKLRGVYATDEDLFEFIDRTRIRDLSMENVTLTSGTFRKIFDHCTSEKTSIQTVFFDDLYEQDDMVFFDGPGKPKFPIRGPPTNGCSTLERKKTNIKQPIPYNLPEGGPYGSPETIKWRQNQRLEYGPM